MKRFSIFILCTFLSVCAYCGDKPADDILSLINMKPEEATPEQVSNILGKPEKIEEGRKQAVWYYNTPTSSLVIYWDNRISKLEKFSFTSMAPNKGVWQNSMSKHLKSGQTNLQQAIKALGEPKDMIIKSMNQELHYAYQNNVLRLFFRKGTLVNYTLY